MSDKDVFDEFAEAMRKKFNEALNKDSNRSKEPWKDYDYEFLEGGVIREFIEFLRAYSRIEASEECIDIAEFCMFYWKKEKMNYER